MNNSVVLMGALLGFGSGVFAYTVLGFGLFLSISIWAASGPISVLLLGAVYMMRADQMERANPSQPEVA
jgi:hypothetical protein